MCFLLILIDGSPRIGVSFDDLIKKIAGDLKII
jgi:hypothetical protein